LPTITVLKNDIEKLAGRGYTLSELEEALLVAKAELKDYDFDTDEIKLELNDTNRPDLWTAEGVARQLRCKRLGKGDRYAFYTKRPASPSNNHRVLVDERLKDIRPYIACLRVRGVELSEQVLGRVIDCQDKLAENLGRRRKVLAIGISRAAAIKFPVHFRAGDPDKDSFVPLEMDHTLTLREILEQHPTGKRYAHLVASNPVFPLLTDSSDRVISMPPIINCRDLGEVRSGDTDFFVDVTGTDMNVVLLGANIIAADFADRGGRIVPVTTEYPYSTPLGREVPAPYDLMEPVCVELSLISKVLGVSMEMSRVRRLLLEIGHRKVKSVGRGRRALEVHPQPFRADLMHPVDVAEDVAISRGYDSFEPIMPERFTIGKSAPIEGLSRRLRETMIGAGFQECLSLALNSRDALLKNMRLEGAAEGELVEIDNVMSELYSTVRNSLLPSLLNVEALSSKAAYPHRVFEVGEVARVVAGEVAAGGTGGPAVTATPAGSGDAWDISHATPYDPGPGLDTATYVNAAACIAHPKASFSELHSYMDALFFYLGIKYELAPADHPSFMEGRAGDVTAVVGGERRAVGLIGEVHPEVLERWGITMPVAAFELSLSRLIER
jgi:phenylalanyl-tRNA synthetase beta chain